MSGTFTDTADRAVLSWLAGETLPSGWAPPTDTYLALLTADPRILPIPPGGDTPEFTNDPSIADFSEVSATGYSRQQLRHLPGILPAFPTRLRLPSDRLRTALVWDQLRHTEHW